jgi:hypothetical protein
MKVSRNNSDLQLNLHLARKRATAPSHPQEKQ